MQREIIPSRQAVCLMIMFIIGSAIVLSPGSSAKQDVWIAILLAMAVSFPVYFIYSRLTIMFPGKDLYDILHILYGNFIGKVLSLAFVWYFFHLGAMVMRNFSEFIRLVSIPETPQFAITLCMGILCIWAVRAGLEVLARWAGFVLPLLLAIVLITLLLSMTKIESFSLKPVLYDGLKPVLNGALSVFTFPFAETVVFTTILNSLRKTANAYKVYVLSVVIAGLLMLMVSIRNVMLLGFEASSMLYFPTYAAVSVINIAEFFQRNEVVVSMTFLLGGFIKVSVCLYAASKGLARVLNITEYRHLAAPMGLLMMDLSILIYCNIMEMFDWAFNIYSFYALPFQVLLPVVTFIIALFAAPKLKKKQPKA